MLRVAEEFHATHTGQQRRANEDAYYARSPLFAVADGMGGAQAGEIASRIAVETLAAGLPEGDEALEHRLAYVVQDANGRIHELARADERRAGMGTTMTVALVGEDDLTIAHVGDSRLYLLRDGHLSRLTRDHSLVEELLQQGKLTPEEASHHPQRSVITRAVGPEAHVEVDTQTVRARDGDLLLICSDGLTTMIDEAEVERLLAEAPSLQAAGHALVDAANAAGGRDNITVVLFRLEDVAAGRPEPATAVADQATSAGDDALRTSDVQAALEAEGRREGRLATLERPGGTTGRAATDTGARRLDPAPPPPGDRPGGRRPRGRLRKAIITLAILGILGVPLVGGALVAVRAVYFVGVGDSGYVTVFRGMPYDLPFGIGLYQENYVSPIPAAQVPAGRREALTDQSLRSQDDAYDLVRQLELGRLQGTE